MNALHNNKIIEIFMSSTCTKYMATLDIVGLLVGPTTAGIGACDGSKVGERVDADVGIEGTDGAALSGDAGGNKIGALDGREVGIPIETVRIDFKYFILDISWSVCEAICNHLSESKPTTVAYSAGGNIIYKHLTYNIIITEEHLLVIALNRFKPIGITSRL